VEDHTFLSRAHVCVYIQAVVTLRGVDITAVKERREKKRRGPFRLELRRFGRPAPSYRVAIRTRKCLINIFRYK